MKRAYQLNSTTTESGRAYQLGGKSSIKKPSLIKPQISVPKKPVGFLETLKYLPSATWEQFTGGAKFPEKMKTSEKMEFFAKELPSASKQVAVQYAKLIPRAFVRVASDVADPFIHWIYGVETPEEPTPTYPLIGEVPTTRKLYSQYREGGYSPLVSGLLAGSDVAMNFAIVLGVGEFFAKKVPVKTKTTEVKISYQKTPTGFKKVGNLTNINKSNTIIANQAKYYKIGSKSLVEIVPTKEGTLQMTGFDISKTQFQNFIKKITNVGITKTVNNPQVKSLIIPDKAINTAIKSLVSKKVSPTVPIAVKGAIPPVPTPVKPVVKAIPKELEPLAKEARKYKSAEEFVKAIATDTYAPESRNPLADYWRSKYVKPLEKMANDKGAHFSTNVFQFESGLNDRFEFTEKLRQGLSKKELVKKLDNMSVQQKSEIVIGKKFTELYQEMLDNNLIKFQTDFYAQATKPIKEVKPELKSTQNTEYNQLVNKTKEQPVDAITKEDLDILARGELKTITPEGAKPINPEKEAMDKIIDLYAGFPISKLADIPITFNGTKMSLINTLGKAIVRYHGLTPDVKKLLIKLETVPDLTKDQLEEFFMSQFPVSTEDAKLLAYHQENPDEYPITPELEPYAERIKS
ncbi:MAG: hypothetical protein ACTSQA_06745, partial [Candidatus Heimdallarchaeaceae archaeon]